MATADDVTFNNVTVNDTFKAGDVTINNSGIDAGNHTITNVANGTQDSDAVNLSQLNATNANVANNTQNITNNANNITNNTNAIANNTQNITNNTNTINKGINFGNGTSANNFALGDTINVTSDSNLVVSTVTDGVKLTLADSITVGNVTVNDTFKAGDVTINNSGIDAGNHTITNVANGTQDSDAVNLSQLNASKVSVEEGNNVNITSTTDANGTVYTVNANASTVSNGSDKVTVTPTDKGNNVTDYAVDLSDAAKDSLDKADSALQSWTAQVNGADAKVVNQTSSTVDFIDGSNINITNEGGKIKVSTANEVTFNNVTVNDTFKAGDVTINNSGIDAGNTTITNVANGTNATDAVNLSQLEKYIGDNSYNWNLSDGTNSNPVPDDGTVAITGSANGDSANTTGIVTGLDGTNVSVDLSDKAKEDIQQGVDANTTVSKGFDINGDNNAPDNVQLGETVDFKGDSNIITTVSDNAIAFALNSSIAVENVTVNDTFKAGDVTINNSGIDAGNHTITNVANGTNATDAVNVAQLEANTTRYYSVNSNVSGNRNNDGATGANAMAAGANAAASGENATAIGYGTKANSAAAVAIGSNANATSSKGDSVIAIGNNAQSTGSYTIAIGTNSVANHTWSMAMGINAKAIDDYATALGSSAQATSQWATALGAGANATESAATAVGSNASASADGATVIGYSSSVTGANTTALGNHINVNTAGSVVLGNSSAAAEATTETTATVNNLTYSGFAGADNIATGDYVSIGSAGQERQIKNVAPGNISATSTDAINGSQLHATNQVLGNVTDSVVNNFGGNAAVDQNGNITFTDIGGTGETTIHDAIKNVSDVANTGWNVQTNGDTATKVAPGDTVQFKDGKNINITRTDKDITVATADDVDFNSVNTSTLTAGPVTINNNGIDAGDTKITNVSKGTEDSDAVNFAQLKDYVGDNSYNWNLSDGTNSNPVPDDGTVAITGSANGDSANTTGIVTALDGTNVSVDLSDKAKDSLDKADTAIQTLTTSADGVVAQTLSKDDNNANFTSGKNIVLTPSATGIAIATADNVTFDTVNATTFNAGDVVINQDGINAGNHTITNVAPGVNGTDAVNVDQLREVNATANAGWNLTTNGQNSSNVAPNATVDLANTDGNINITNDGTNVTFGLNSNLTVGGKDGKDGQIGVKGADGKDGITITPDTIVFNGVNGKDGVDGQSAISVNGVDGKDGVNGTTITRIEYTDPNTNTTQTVATLEDGLKFTGNNNGTVNSHTLNSLVNIVGEGVSAEAAANFTSAAGNINVVADGTDTLTVQLAKELTNLTSAVFGGDTTINGEGVTISNGTAGSDVSLTKEGLDNGNNTITNVATGVNGTDAVNVDQLTQTITDNAYNWHISDGTNTTDVPDDGTVAVKGSANADSANVSGIVTTLDGTDVSVDLSDKAKDSLDKADTAIQTLTTSADGVVAQTLNKDDNNANFTSGKNIVLTPSATGIAIATADNVTFDTVNATTFNAGDVVINQDGINAGNHTITNVAPGVNGTDAVNVDQLREVNATANAGWNLTTNGQNSSNVAPNATVDLANTDGNINITNDGNNVTFGLNSNLTVGGKDGKDGQIGVKGADGKDGITITKDAIVYHGVDGADGTSSIGVNGKDGKAGVDGTNITRIEYTDPNGTNHTVATLEDGLKFTGNNNGTVNSHTLNSLVNIVGEGVSAEAAANFTSAAGNINVVADGTDTLTVQLAKELTNLTSAVFGGDTTINGEGVTISNGTAGSDVSLTKEGLDNGNNTITNVATGVNGTDAVNVDQLTQTITDNAYNWHISNGTNTTDVPDDGTVAVKGSANADSANVSGIVTTLDGTDVSVDLSDKAKDSLDKADTAIQTLTTSADGVVAQTLNKDDNNANFTSGKNIVLTPSATGIAIATADNVTFDTVNATTFNAGDVVINQDGINAGNHTITNVAAGVNGTDAVNVDQLREVNATANAGWNLTTNGQNSSNVAPNATVDLANTDGNINITNDGTNVTFDLNSNLTVGGKDGKDGQIGAMGANGTGVVLNGKDGTIGIDGKDGTNGTVTLAQGPAGVDGVNGTDRIVYETPNGTSTVATLDDGLIFAGNNNDTLNRHKLNTQVNIVGEGVDKDTSANFTSAAGNINVVADGNSTLVVQLAQDLVNLTSATFTNGTTNTVVNGNGVTINGGDNGTVSLTDTGLNNGNNTITNVAAGQNGTDAVNVDQLREVNATANAGWNLTTNGQNSSNVAPNATVDLANTDGNINITNDGTNVTFGLNSNLTVGGKDGKDGQIGVKGADGKDGITITKDAIVYHGVDGADGTSSIGVNGKDGKAGVDGTNITRIEYTDPNGTNHTVATLEDGLKFTGNNNGTVNNHTLNSLVNIVGEGVSAEAAANFTSAAGNINVVADGTDTLTIQLAQNLTNLTGAAFTNGTTNTVVIDGTTGKVITGNVSISKDGLDNGGNKIINVAAGTNDTDAVNVSQLNASTAANAWKITGNNDDANATIVGNQTVSFNNGSNTVAVVNGTNVTFDLADNIALTNNGSMTIGSTVITNGNIKVGDNVTVTDTGFTAGNVSVTTSGINAGGNTITNVAPGVNGTDAVNVDQLNAVNATANAGWNLTANGNNSSNVKPNDTVDLANKDGNVNITKDGSNVTFDLSDTLNIGSGANTVVIDGTTGKVSTGDASISKDGISAGNQTITNVAAGTNGTDAVNVDQLREYTANVATQPLTFAGDTGTPSERKLGSTVTVKGGVTDTAKLTDNNIGVVSDGQGTLNVKLAKDLSGLNSVTISNGSASTKLTTVTKTNVEGKEASALDVGGNQITNVAPGEVSKNSTDAVNGSQLHATNQQVIRNANAINQVAGKVHSVDRKLRAGVAGALASGGLYHATSPGKSMVAAGAGTYRGESAIAVGYSRLSDNGKLGVKFSVNSNTRGDAGAAASIGYQW
ncbi:hypothetical protein CBG46_10360 [Actinobacillus succinogenes]|uniref:YadA-like family protein n=1 Tax=Actinobacillus succinogenes TaxID=67854 RepID=UPI000BFF0037|nr:YadA-like family protein [Actinobacillus succinogenes]PHI41056.1 hypothetical protein CBG46_10360 [Actinobacillus succinogenes]